MAEITSSDLRFFQYAKEEAKKSTYTRGIKVGCVIVYKHKVVSTGHNEDKTSPLQHKYNKYRKFNNAHGPVADKNHAELKAISAIPYTVSQDIQWRDVSIYVYRIANGLPGKMGLARPCKSCMKFLTDLGIRNIYYTSDNNSYIYERVLND